MGADKPQWKISETKSQTQPLFPFVAAFLLVAIALAYGLDVKEKSVAPELSPQEKAKLEKRLKEIDDSEQYALITKENGWYPCLHSGRAMCYMKAGEIWKYGVTSKGVFGRYSTAFLFKNKVSYIVQFKGNLSECMKQEQIKLYNYPNSPENLARPQLERLPRPPYNAIMR